MRLQLERCTSRVCVISCRVVEYARKIAHCNWDIIASARPRCRVHSLSGNKELRLVPARGEKIKINPPMRPRDRGETKGKLARVLRNTA